MSQDQKPSNDSPEDKFKAMRAKKMGGSTPGGVSMSAPASKPTPAPIPAAPAPAKPEEHSKISSLFHKKDAKPVDDTPFTDGKEALISQNITETLEVDIKNRKEQFFQGKATTVSSLNNTGEFDVLPKHANFVTLIRGYVIVDKGLPSEKKFDIDNGVLAAKTGEVDIYLDF